MEDAALHQALLKLVLQALRKVGSAFAQGRHVLEETVEKGPTIIYLRQGLGIGGLAVAEPI